MKVEEAAAVYFSSFNAYQFKKIVMPVKKITRKER